jgi:hypothetical protein
MNTGHEDLGPKGAQESALGTNKRELLQAITSKAIDQEGRTP